VNLTFGAGGGRGLHKKKNEVVVTPSFRREFQLVSGGQEGGHTPHLRLNNNNKPKKTAVSIWGLSSTLNRMWSGGRGRVSRGRGPNRRRQSFHGSHGLTSDEESDYAYIDRSTHSITGYLNGRGHRHSGGHAHSTLSTCADSVSPYATTHVLHHHHHHHHQAKRQKIHQVFRNTHEKVHSAQ
jgi:hypothetical protein